MVNGESIAVNIPSQAAIGRALGLSPASITKLKNQGMPVDSVASAQAWRVARQNVAARKPVAPAVAPAPRLPVPPPAAAFPPLDRPDDAGFDTGEDHDAARTRLRISEANLSEMREAEERGALIRVDAVKAALSVAMATVREALLQIPSRLAPLLAADTDPASVQNLLHAEIHQALEHLSGAGSRLGQPVADLE